MSLPSCHCLGWGTLRWRLQRRPNLAGAEALRVPFGCVVPYSWGGRFGEIQRFVSEGRWEQVRTEAKRTGRVQQRVWLAQWVSGGEGRKGVAHQQPKARVGKKRKLTVG